VDKFVTLRFCSWVVNGVVVVVTKLNSKRGVIEFFSLGTSLFDRLALLSCFALSLLILSLLLVYKDAIIITGGSLNVLYVLIENKLIHY
jgi:hypothetical protein